MIENKKMILSQIKNCNAGSLTVIRNFPTKYCGNTTVNVESTSNKIIVMMSPSGRFFCQVQPVKRIKDSITNCNCGSKNPVCILHYLFSRIFNKLHPKYNLNF